MTEIHTAYYESPIGVLKVRGSKDGIPSLEFLDKEVISNWSDDRFLKECLDQLHEYFMGARKRFSLKLCPKGTEFQKAVWQQLAKIPYGHTASYTGIANAIGNEKAVRAVGAANGQNRIPIIIPCHRVIGSDGSLVGFGGGIWRKEFLLRHENVFIL